MEAISSHLPQQAMPEELNPDLRNRCWDNKKVDAHHAIIPTARRTHTRVMENGQYISGPIARPYLMQFCPPAISRKFLIALGLAGCDC